jgi:hypothetical protein
MDPERSDEVRTGRNSRKKISERVVEARKNGEEKKEERNYRFTITTMNTMNEFR